MEKPHCCGCWQLLLSVWSISVTPASKRPAEIKRSGERPSEKRIHGAERYSSWRSDSGELAVKEILAEWGSVRMRRNEGICSPQRRRERDMKWQTEEERHAEVSVKWNTTVLFTLLACSPCHSVNPLILPAFLVLKYPEQQIHSGYLITNQNKWIKGPTVRNSVSWDVVVAFWWQ